jgi:pyruvate/2-oxoglutarate dehydrogenase complex dihydrolipoamide dehydrogenase (E3) component
MQMLTPDLCILGAGSGGLSVAAAAAQLGANAVLIEKERMGGDCLNWGCVPSKALIAAGKRAQAMRTGTPFGVKAQEPDIDFPAVMAHVRGVIRQIEPNDSIERFSGLGVQVIEAEGRFLDPRTVVAGGYEIKARRFVIATGSSPALPPISGLDQVPYLTNRTLFGLTERPRHLVVIGGGPIGMEMAQAFRRLGSDVTVIEAFQPLAKDDPELAAVVLRRLAEEGVEVLADTRVERVAKTADGIEAFVSSRAGPRTVRGSHLLVAAGRRPNTASLGLERAGIEADGKGIRVARTLLTSNRRVYAIGDVIGGMQFTHMANYHAGIVIRRALFRLPARVATDAVPWVTFTDPELAHVGLSEAEARARHGRIRILRWPYAENDRAVAERQTEGEIKVIADRRGRILGADIVGAEAGELIQMWTLAIGRRLSIRAMTEFISPYPTLSEISKRAAYTYYSSSLTSPLVRRIIGWLGKLG